MCNTSALKPVAWRSRAGAGVKNALASNTNQRFSMASAFSSAALPSAMQNEQQRIDDVKSSFRVLHRWTDKSWGAGFDVLVFPKCVMLLDPVDPASSKVIVFPTNQEFKVRVFYKKNAECCETPICRDSSKPASAVTSSSPKFISELRICAREIATDVSNDDFFRTASPSDIVLRWIDAGEM